jgi:hypothetical protein
MSNRGDTAYGQGGGGSFLQYWLRPSRNSQWKCKNLWRVYFRSLFDVEVSASLSTCISWAVYRSILHSKRQSYHEVRCNNYNHVTKRFVLFLSIWNCAPDRPSTSVCRTTHLLSRHLPGHNFICEGDGTAIVRFSDHKISGSHSDLQCTHEPRNVTVLWRMIAESNRPQQKLVLMSWSCW